MKIIKSGRYQEGGWRPSFLLSRRFPDDCRASVTVEFALLSIPLIGIIFFSLYVAIFLFVEACVTQVVQTQARRIMTGEQARLDTWRQKNQPSTSLAAAFQRDSASLLPAGFPVGSFNISVDSALRVRDIRPGSAPSGYAPGGASSIVLVTASYKLPILSGGLSSFQREFFNLDLTDTVTVSTLVKAEPY